MPSGNGSILIKPDFSMIFPATATRPNAGSIIWQPNLATFRTAYGDGTGPGQFKKWAYKELTFAVSTPQTIDFSTIACGDESAGFAHLRGLLIWNAATDLLRKITAGNASDPLAYWLSSSTTTWTIDAGEFWVKQCPLTTLGYVIDSAHKNLKLDPGAYAFPATLFAWGD